MSLAARIVALGVFFTSLTLAGKAQADELDRFKAVNELKAQKLLSEVKASLAEARTLEKSNPVRAREILRKLQSRLEDDVVLTNLQRTALLRQVRDQLVTATRAVRAEEAADEAAADKAFIKKRETQRRDPQGQPARGPSDVAKDYYKSVTDSIDAGKSLRGKQEKGFQGAMRDIDRSAADIQEQRITDRFVMASQKRMQKLTKKEQALLKALNSVLSVEFDSRPFRQVIDFLQEKTGQAIILDDGSLKEAMIEQDDPVTFKARKLTVRTILRKVLGDRGLTYIIKEGTLQVVTPQRARESMVVRTYPIADLVGANAQFGFWGQLMAAQMAQTLIQTIQTTVDPEIWTQGASIVYYPPTMALIVRAPAELHFSMGYGSGR